MGGLTGAVHWWEESQLRVLVLTSMVIQFYLLYFPMLRTRAISGRARFIMWLAYHAGDAVAIYALATLFNRHKDQGDGGDSSSNTLLEVVWAPVLLIHLGGSDGVTAYNIEDNELWSRHLLTAASQVTVAVYVFCKSWPPGSDDGRLLEAAILLFIIGVGKCFMKAIAFKKASIYSLVSKKNEGAAEEQINDGNMYNCHTLEEYVEQARVAIRQQIPGTVTTTFLPLAVDAKKRAPASLSSSNSEGSSNRPRSPLSEREEARNDYATRKLFVDISSSYPHRIRIFKKFWGLREERAYDSLKGGLAGAFFLLYTKLQTTIRGGESKWGARIRLFIILIRYAVPWAPVGLFHQSHREAYNGTDVKVTYAILCCTAFLEAGSWYNLLMEWWRSKAPAMYAQDGQRQVMWPEMVAQYSLAGYFVRNKKHRIKMRIVSFVGCKDLLDQLWCMEPCFSSFGITHLVLRYLKDGWEKNVRDAASYRSFNNHSSHWSRNMNRPFDESVLLWHMATDFCFFLSSEHRCASAEVPTTLTCVRDELIEEAGRREVEAKIAPGTSSSVENNQTSTSQRRQESLESKDILCRQMSNYMVYLLFLNPEMLLPGSRRNLFKTAYKDILLEVEDNKPSRFATAYKQVKDILLLDDNKRNVYKGVTAAFKEMKDILKDNKRNPLSWSQWKAAPVKEEFLMERLISAMLDKPRQASEEELEEGRTEEPKGGYKENLINDAWILAQRLLDKGEEMMWDEIQKVWVEMLCFSASRCRGYLHAKALGKGGEFLSYVWLLLFHMGMETFTDKLQREQKPPSHDAGVSTTSTMDWLQREHLPSQGGNQYGSASSPEIYQVPV